MILDDIDKKILKSLTHEGLHPSEISRRTTICRTTVGYRLKRLEKYSRVKKKLDGRKVIWNLCFKERKSTSFLDIYKEEDFYNTYLEILKVPSKSVVLSVQGVLAGKKEIENIPRSLVLKIHRNFKRRGIVFKSISNIKILDLVKDLDNEYIKSHRGRGGGMKLLQNSIFLEAGEIFVSKEFVIISNPEKKIAIILRDVSLVKIFYEIFSLLFDSLEDQKILDLNKYLDQELTQ